MAKKWKIANKLKTDNLKFTIEDIRNILLENRGIKTKAKVQEFFEPTHPNKMKARDYGIDDRELQKAITRIKKAKKTGERVIVWGDYDADGICGAAVLWEALYYNGINALPFIPERRTEGYGLNVARMRKMKDEDPSVGLIITVDNGIVANEKVDLARELGVDVIITDHHVPRNVLPKAYVVLHTTKVCGAAVAWVLAREFPNSKYQFPNDHLGIVALAMVADLVPLVGPARSLVYHGLPAIRKTDRVGIKDLCAVAGIDQSKITTHEIGFVIAPRLNAMGRLENALTSLRLLCTKSRGKAREFAQKLQETNAARQQLVRDTVVHAREQVLASKEDSSLIFIAHETYHEGIVGLVASRLVEEFGRPTFVVFRGEEFSRGSARSIPGFNIVSLIESAREFLIEGGGHPMAAGFTARTEHLEILSKALRDGADGSLTNEVLTPKIKIDSEIPLSSITLELAREISKFEPFGIGNPEPVFATRGVRVIEARLVGTQNQHLKLQLSPIGFHPRGVSTNIDAIGFGMRELYGKLSSDKSIDIAYNLQIDKWNGNEKIQLRLKDIAIVQ